MRLDYLKVLGLNHRLELMISALTQAVCTVGDNTRESVLSTVVTGFQLGDLR